jgi:hypothetical protein
MKTVVLVPMLLSLSVALLSASAEEPPLTLRVESTRAQWEVNERTGHVLKITNQSSRPVTLPSFRFLNAKVETRVAPVVEKGGDEAIGQGTLVEFRQSLPIDP